MADRRKKDSYFKTMAAVAPVFALKSIASDLPKASLESLITEKMRGNKAPAFKILKAKATKGPMGRARGGLFGIATAPIFLKGLSMAGSKDRKERAKGQALMLGSGSAFVGVKGISEGLQKYPGPGRAPKIRGLALTRILSKAPGTLMLGATLAASQAKKKKTGKDSLLIPVLGGAATGGLGRGLEKLVAHKKGQRLSQFKRTNLAKTFKRIKPNIVGGVVAGAAGGLVLDRLMSAAKRRMKRK